MFSVLYIYFLVYFFIINNQTVVAEVFGPPASDFRRHSIVQPVVQHARTKREIITTRDERGLHHSEVIIKITVDGEEYILDLWLNQDLITGNHLLRYKKNGKTVLHKPKVEELDLCHYGGSIRERPNSWVALSTCHGVQGVMFDGEKMKYIEPAQGRDISSKHYMYDHADLSKSYQCGHLGSVTNNSSDDPHIYRKYYPDTQILKNRIFRYKRYASKDKKVYGPYNEDKSSRYVELVLVADNREYMANGADLRTVHRRMATLANIINSVYSPLNIFIALVGVVVWTERDEIYLEEEANITLYNFLEYRNTQLAENIPNDNAHLLTHQKFTAEVIGKAMKGGICSSKYSGGVATDHSLVIGLVAATIAHEMGHNFGMDHDTDVLCECPDQKCIMSPSSTSVTPVHWSSCSLNSLARSFEGGMDYCLRNKPKRLFGSPTCGNGFVEPGEQCDCGTITAVGAYNPCHACCNPSTCMLRSNATCGAGMCCDLQTCRPKSAGTLCRSADRECDLPEYCTGNSEYCPDDVYKMDTTPCGEGEHAAYCVRGRCRSHTYQCRLLWGVTGKSSHNICYYNNNVKGNEYGNCGYNRYQKHYLPCAKEDAMCGTLQCLRLPNRLQFGSNAYQSSATNLLFNGEVIQCYTASVDMGLNDVDPGLVPDGAKCGDGKMCRQQKCVPVANVRQLIGNGKSSVCPSDCSGHGVCNSAGHCHCEPGFAPPLCAFPGPGGSYDSGPASDPTNAKKVMIAMYVIFLGIVPSMVLILYLIFHFRPTALLHCNVVMKDLLKFFNINQDANIEDLQQENSNHKEYKPDLKATEPIYANSGDIFKQQKIEKPPRKINTYKIEMTNENTIGQAIIQASNLWQDKVNQISRENIAADNNTPIYANQDFQGAYKIIGKGHKQMARKIINKDDIKIARQEIETGGIVTPIENKNKEVIKNTIPVNIDSPLAGKMCHKGDNQTSQKYINKDDDQTIRPKVGKHDNIACAFWKYTPPKMCYYSYEETGNTTEISRPKLNKVGNTKIGAKDNKNIIEDSTNLKKEKQIKISDKEIHKNYAQGTKIINLNEIKMAINKINKDNIKVADNKDIEKKPMVNTVNANP